VIELPYQPEGPAPDPYGPGGRPVRRVGWALLAVAVLVIGIAVVVNRARVTRPVAAPSASPSAPSSAPGSAGAPSGSNGPAPSTPGGSNGPAPSGQAVRCPQIRDTRTHLSYRCITDTLIQVDGDLELGLRISLQQLVEPNWVIGEGSGDADAGLPPDAALVGYRATAAAPATPDEVRAKVLARAAAAVDAGYGPSPGSRILSGERRDFGGVSGYELLTEITMNAAFRKQSSLKALHERLWVVGLPTPAGVGIFMLTIPDDRADLWPQAEATVGSVRVI
jgi:hypothetical protein